MCGIFGVVGDSNAAETVLDGLKKLEYRGYDSWGVAVEIHGKTEIEKHTGKIGEAHTSLHKSSVGFGHTRWATHGGVTDINAHPHKDCSGKLAVIHNGIIENYQELREQLKAQKHKFVSETDTEVFAHLIEQHLRSHQSSLLEAVRRAFLELKGMNALIAFDAEHQSFVAAKTGSPLVVGKSANGQFYFASDASALAGLCEEVLFLQDEEIVEISLNGVELFALNGKLKKLRFEPIPYTQQDSGHVGFPDYMTKEMQEQPGILRAVAQYGADKLGKLADAVRDAERVALIGCGTASFAALFGEYVLASRGKKLASRMLGNECRHVLPLFSKKDLPIFLSQSGETADIIEMHKLAQHSKLKTGALVNAYSSTLHRMANVPVLLDAGPERCVLSTKSFTAKIAHLWLLAAMLQGEEKQAQQELTKAAQACDKVLDPSYADKYLAPLAEMLLQSHTEHIFSMGRGLMYPIALEAALKVKEVSYIHVEGFAGGELKHGVIALIEKGVPCIVFVPKGEGKQEMLSNAMEVKARGAFVIGISPEPNEVFDAYLPVEGEGDLIAFPANVVAQQLAYLLGTGKGFDPDKPRNLAKSVVVK